MLFCSLYLQYSVLINCAICLFNINTKKPSAWRIPCLARAKIRSSYYLENLSHLGMEFIAQSKGGKITSTHGLTSAETFPSTDRIVSNRKVNALVRGQSFAFSRKVLSIQTTSYANQHNTTYWSTFHREKVKAEGKCALLLHELYCCSSDAQ